MHAKEQQPLLRTLGGDLGKLSKVLMLQQQLRCTTEAVSSE